jgi:hypothetical protein
MNGDRIDTHAQQSIWRLDWPSARTAHVKSASIACVQSLQPFARASSAFLTGHTHHDDIQIHTVRAANAF